MVVGAELKMGGVLRYVLEGRKGPVLKYKWIGKRVCSGCSGDGDEGERERQRVVWLYIRPPLGVLARMNQCGGEEKSKVVVRSGLKYNVESVPVAEYDS